MTDTANLARLEGLIARLERLAPAPAPLLNLPGYVAPGELIESAWGNAVVETLVTFVGCGAYTTNQVIPATTNSQIAWLAEAYDTHAFHVPSAVEFYVPAGEPGVYACTLSLTTDRPTEADSLVRLIIGPSGSLKQAIIPTGQSSATASWTGPMTGGSYITGEFWNAGPTAINVAGSLEVVRTAIM